MAVKSSWTLAAGLLLVAAVVGAALLFTAPTPEPEPEASEGKTERLRWVPGDMHVHSEALAQQGKPEFRLKPEQVQSRLKAAGLEVGSCLIWGVRPAEAAEHFTGQEKDRLSDPIVHYDLEVSSYGASLVDHMIALNLKEFEHPRRLFTLPIYRWALAQKGSLVGAAHANHWTPDPLKVPVRRQSQAPTEFPLCVALGLPLYLATEILDSKGFCNLYYGLLNCGFKVPLAGGSDWPVAGAEPGEVRTWVAVRGKLTYSKWIEGIRAGRTVVGAYRDFALVTLGKQRALPGDTIELSGGPQSLPLELRCALASPQVVQLIVNGEVVQNLQVHNGINKLNLTVTDSCWVALRGTRVHTGPIYVSFDGRPIRASAKQAAWFRDYCDTLFGYLRGETFTANRVAEALGREWADPKRYEQERKAALAAYAPAKAVFERIRKEAEERAKLLKRAH